MSEKRNVEKREQTLARGIQSWHVTLIALGGIIGSCYFIGLGLTFSEMGAGAVLISYALAGVTIFGVMQSFSELLVNIPRRGSFVSYTREFMGDTASAGIGWAFWCNWVAYIPSEALAVAIYINVMFFPGPDTTPYHMRTFIIGIITLLILTLINIYHVKWFGHIESIMAVAKIVAVILFVAAAVLIWFGIFNQNGATLGNEEGATAAIAPGFIGFDALLAEEGKSVMEQLFPSGGAIIVIMMIWTLVNFQGSEIVGLSASETQNPEVNVPAACKKVAYRIIGIYLIPIFALSLIMPYFTATLDGAVFAQALIAYGFGWGAKLFTVVTMIAAFSCANAGFYGTVRSMYGLSSEGLAPKFLSKLNRFNTPQNATIFTLGGIWIVYVITFAFAELGVFGGEDNVLYMALIGIAGFTGTLCWAGVLYSQITFRKRLKERGYNWREVLNVKAIGFPSLAWFSLILQIAAMALLIFEESDGVPIFMLSMDIIIVPIVIYQVQKWRGKAISTQVLGADEITFEMKFPIKPGSLAEKKKADHDAKLAAGKTTKGGAGVSLILIAVTIVSLVLSVMAISANPADFNGEGPFGEDMMPVWKITLGCLATYVVIAWGLVRLNKIKPGE